MSAWWGVLVVFVIAVLALVLVSLRESDVEEARADAGDAQEAAGKALAGVEYLLGQLAQLDAEQPGTGRHHPGGQA